MVPRPSNCSSPLPSYLGYLFPVVSGVYRPLSLMGGPARVGDFRRSDGQYSDAGRGESPSTRRGPGATICRWAPFLLHSPTWSTEPELRGRSLRANPTKPLTSSCQRRAGTSQGSSFVLPSLRLAFRSAVHGSSGGGVTLARFAGIGNATHFPGGERRAIGLASWTPDWFTAPVP